MVGQAFISTTLNNRISAALDEGVLSSFRTCRQEESTS